MLRRRIRSASGRLRFALSGRLAFAASDWAIDALTRARNVNGASIGFRRGYRHSRILGTPSETVLMQPHGGSPQKIVLPGVKHVVAVASGKGGVGKSTVATNLALALAMHGRRVGLLDADIYGPSIPIMMGIKDVYDPNTTQFPLDRHGLKLMSMGFWVKPETAMIWRG